MALYRVKPGFTHGARDEFKAGDTVEHTEAEAAGFRDKLQLISKPVAPPSPGNVVVVETPDEAPPTVDEALATTPFGERPDRKRRK